MIFVKPKTLDYGWTIFMLMLSVSAYGGVDNNTDQGTGREVTSGKDTTSDWWYGRYATGEWAGLRSQLEDEGITPYVFYTSIVAGNPVGGLAQVGPRYAQDVSLGLTFDLQKLVGWEGATINLNGIDRFGKTIRPEVGSIYDPVEIYGGQTLFLYNVTLEQKFWKDRGTFKVGRFSPGDDFATSPLYGYYVSDGIDGQIRAVIDDTRFATYPFASWAARLRFDPSPEFNVMTGVFEVSDQLTNHDRHGVNFGINGQDGTQIVQQFGWTPEFDKQPVEPGSSASANHQDAVRSPTLRGLPGHYFIGAYWSNSDYRQFGSPTAARLSYGFYAHADQMVYRKAPGSDLGLTLFGTVAYAPQQNISILPFQLSGGALYQGLLPSRPQDMSVFGVIYGNFSHDYAAAVAQPLGGTPETEIDFEVGYRVQVAQFAYIQPDVQYIVQPGGTGDIPNAVILGAQIGITF
jgi:porin